MSCPVTGLPERWQVNPRHPTMPEVEGAATAITAGQLIAIPTETYYALAVDVRCFRTLERLLKLKGRSSADKPLLLLVSSTSMARRHSATIPKGFEALAAACWPGPLTLIVPAAATLPRAVVSVAGNVAMRVSPHPVAATLLRAVGAPITGTSANLAEEAPHREAGVLIDDLGLHIDGVLDGGPTKGGPASTLLDLTADPACILRSGAVDRQTIERALRSA